MRSRIAPVAAAFALWVPSFTPPPALAANLYGLIDTGEIYKSTNHGVTWSATGAIAVRDAVGLAAGSSATELYIAARSGTVYRSTNSGVNWSAVGAITASDAVGFVVHYDASLLVLTQTGTLYRSTNQGASFTALAALTGSNWVTLARGPLGRLYALTQTGEVAESQNGGSTWATVGAVPVSNAVGLSRRGAELFLMVATGEVARSLNYGRTWTTVGAMTSSNMAALADLGGLLVAAAGTGEIATSSNGVVWSWVGAINQLTVTALGTDTPQATGVVTELTPPRFTLQAPYPNPRVGAGGATFSFTAPQADFARLELYDARGRLVATRPAEWFAGPGDFAMHWDPERLAAGTYLVRFSTDSGDVAYTKWTLAR